MKRILFVDDDLNVLESLRDSFRKHRGRWDMVFVSSARAALIELENRPFDVVVSDMQMPVTDGATLLAQVRDRYPRTIRLILSGEADEATILGATPVAHLFLSKPCTSGVLRRNLEQACALQGVADDDAIRAMLGELPAPESLPRF